MTNEILISLGGKAKANPNTILLLKADINYTHIFLDDGTTILSSTTLGILEKRLCQYPFFRPNRSVLVNLDYMIEFEMQSASIKMGNNEIFRISRRRAKYFYSISKKSIPAITDIL